jgi:hypothetical protein
LQLIKPLISGFKKNWAANAMEHFYVKKAFGRIMRDNDGIPSIVRESRKYYCYPSLEKLTREYIHAGLPLSGVAVTFDGMVSLYLIVKGSGAWEITICPDERTVTETGGEYFAVELSTAPMISWEDWNKNYNMDGAKGISRYCLMLPKLNKKAMAQKLHPDKVIKYGYYTIGSDWTALLVRPNSEAGGSKIVFETPSIAGVRLVP